MSGVYGAINIDFSENVVHNYFDYLPLKKFNLDEVKTDTNVLLGRVAINKFNQDRFFVDGPDYTACFEGIAYNSNHSKASFIAGISENPNQYLKTLRGVFCGFYYCKKSKEILLFTDHLRTKNIYYHYSPEGGFLFASRLHVLSKMMKKANCSVNYKPESVYSMALMGQLFDDETLLQNVQVLPYAGILRFNLEDNTAPKISQFYVYDESERKLSFDDALEEFNELFTATVRQEWEKDYAYNYQHFSSLSGGMDSRVNLFVAKKLGYQNPTTLAYGYPYSSDLKIAKQIAFKEEWNHLQYQIPTGDFLIENIIQNYLKKSDGLVAFQNSANMVQSYQTIDFGRYGNLHSGQIGGVVKGENSFADFDYQKNIAKLGLNGFISKPELLNKTPKIQDIIANYSGRDFDYFTIEQRYACATLTGDKVAANYGDLVSPFADLSVLRFMLQLPTSYRANGKLFYDWLEKYHPEALAHPYERIGLKPNKSWKRKWGALHRKYYNGAKKYFNLNYDSMNPVGTWFKQNPALLQQMNQIFEAEIHQIKEPELAKDLRDIYQQEIFEYRNKFAVISVLLTIKLNLNGL
ncbi:MAG: hypothetical protein ACQESK_01170 [Bacteroidota bacterium]